MRAIKTIDELIEVLGDSYDGRGVYLNIGGSPGVSNGENYVVLNTFDNIEDLVDCFNEFIDDWCVDYADSYLDYDAMEEAEANDDTEAVDQLLEEAQDECRADCGNLYLTADYDNPNSIYIEFTGSDFLRP